jgi:hypothetical protein
MKVGDYVRTKSGYIDKIININDFREPSMKYALEQPSWNDDIIFIGEEEIEKSSPNIIDLIEVGDYVNGNRVIEIANKSKDIFNKYLLVEETDYDNCNISYSNNDIKSIVTKEQFKSMEYEVKE